jgi:hypothetical protein
MTIESLVYDLGLDHSAQPAPKHPVGFSTIDKQLATSNL